MRAIILFGFLTTFVLSATWVVNESRSKLSWTKAVDFCKKNKGKLPLVKDLKNASSNKFKRYFKKDFYWTREENKNNLEQAKYFNFYDKTTYTSPKEFKLNVRCVVR